MTALCFLSGNAIFLTRLLTSTSVKTKFFEEQKVEYLKEEAKSAERHISTITRHDLGIFRNLKSHVRGEISKIKNEILDNTTEASKPSTHYLKITNYHDKLFGIMFPIVLVFVATFFLLNSTLWTNAWTVAFTDWFSTASPDAKIQKGGALFHQLRQSLTQFSH